MQSCKQGMWRGRLAYKSSSKFSRARSTSGRFKCSYVFCGKSERESESSTFALGPTTETGNEKRRALRKSSERGTICQEKVYERGTFFVKNCIWRNKGVGPRGGASPYKNLSSTPAAPPRVEPRTKDPDSSTTFNFLLLKRPDISVIFSLRSDIYWLHH